MENELKSPDFQKFFPENFATQFFLLPTNSSTTFSDENWRDKYYGTSQNNHYNAATIDRSKALDILGLADPVTREEIKEAHRRLMLANHPDRGGSTFLATQINEAKDFLLEDNE